jgi:ribosomal protein S27AE
MNEEILKKLEQRVNRRSFLRGSGLAAAALIGAAAFPRIAAAQDQQPSDKKDEGDKKDEKKDEPEDEFKVTKKDERGREYRTCPQCGYNMYQQERTWTCENCGYSYTE